MDKNAAKTLGELKKNGYQSRSIKSELRENLLDKLQADSPVFPGIIGYDETVIPDLQHAILARHNILLLGLRGQAKTRIARLMTGLLDEYIPVIAGTALNEDPLNPITREGRDIIAEMGDDSPIHWIHRSERYGEKLATPDVTVADLIGDIDPIKAATMKLSYADARVIHYGIIPRSNRGIFVINELPDLQARIQVALFNILEEGDIQIRGFKLRLPLDILFVFTANPEDYTNRGSIVTPLKDRIESQILTHYPANIDISRQITASESKLPAVDIKIEICSEIKELLELIAMASRNSEYVDSKSGVSARLTIAAYEQLYSVVERRMLLNKESKGEARLTDIFSIVPAITGKLELVYEGEQEGPFDVAIKVIGEAIKMQFVAYFPDPGKLKKKVDRNPYQPLADWFERGHKLDLQKTQAAKSFKKDLASVGVLDKLLHDFGQNKTPSTDYLKELLLYGASEFGIIDRNYLTGSIQFKDFLTGMSDTEGEEFDVNDLLN